MDGITTPTLCQTCPDEVFKTRSGIFEHYGSAIFLIMVEEVYAFMGTNGEQQSNNRADRGLVSDDVGGRQPEEGRDASQNGLL